VSPQRLEQDWQALWKEWDRIIKATDDPEGPYLQNEISYNNPDLADDQPAADLDKVATKLLPLLPLHLASPGPKPFDLARKLSSSLNKIASSHVAYIILPEDVVPLGAATSKLALNWLWQHDSEQKPAAKLAWLGEFLEAIFDGEPSFVLDETTLTSFLEGLGAKERKEMTHWLEKNIEKDPWKQAFDEEEWGPCAPIVAQLVEE